jgi:hypothetical protein
MLCENIMNLNKASLAQDRAAGGPGRRKMRIRSGEIVTVSFVIAGKGSPSRVYLRFRSGGVMVTRPIGNFEAENTFEVLKLAWAKVRTDKIVEQFEWSWVGPE